MELQSILRSFKRPEVSRNVSHCTSVDGNRSSFRNIVYIEYTPDKGQCPHSYKLRSTLSMDYAKAASDCVKVCQHEQVKEQRQFIRHTEKLLLNS
jgi:hypothetical protein